VEEKRRCQWLTIGALGVYHREKERMWDTGIWQS
jgi:hypothetical protein